MPTNKQRWTRRVNRFPDRVSTLSDALRESAIELMSKRTGAYTRAAKCYPGINANSLSKARRTGGVFAELVKYLMAANAKELLRVRAWIDVTLDTLEAEKLATTLCVQTAIREQQEADAAEDVAETDGHLTGDWSRWMRTATEAIARTRLMAVALWRERLVAS